MPQLSTDTPAAEPVVVPPMPKKAAKRKLGFVAWLAIGWIGLLAFAAIAAPILPLEDPLKTIDIPANERTVGGPSTIANQEPSLDHWMGGDGNGRDLLSRVVYGARTSLSIGFGAIALGVVVGGIIGLLAGYFKGMTDTILSLILDSVLAFPALVLALSIVTFLGRSTWFIILALGIVSVPILGRITRAATLSWSSREFVMASRAQGAQHWRIIVRELLPNVVPAMTSIALLGVAVAIVAEGGLAILGAGIQPPTPSWGNIIQEGQARLNDVPHIVLAPAMVIFITVLALNYLGDVVRELLEVRESAL